MQKSNIYNEIPRLVLIQAYPRDLFNRLKTKKKNNKLVNKKTPISSYNYVFVYFNLRMYLIILLYGQINIKFMAALYTLEYYKKIC
jgi:hypothetical protein